MSEYEELLRSAREATEGEHPEYYGADDLRNLLSALVRVVDSTSAVERERCAKICDEHALLATSQDWHEWAASCAQKIREA